MSNRKTINTFDSTVPPFLKCITNKKQNVNGQEPDTALTGSSCRSTEISWSLRGEGREGESKSGDFFPLAFSKD